MNIWMLDRYRDSQIDIEIVRQIYRQLDRYRDSQIDIYIIYRQIIDTKKQLDRYRPSQINNEKIKYVNIDRKIEKCIGRWTNIQIN